MPEDSAVISAPATAPAPDPGRVMDLKSMSGDGSLRDTPSKKSMFEQMDKKWGQPKEPEEKPKIEKPEKPLEEKPEQADGNKPNEETEKAPEKPDPKPGAKTPDPKKQNPWKMYEAEKSRAKQLEAEIATLRQTVTPENDRTKLAARIEAAEKRAEALENEIRHVNYQSSKEFADKYEAPYVRSWQKAMSELSQVAVTDLNTMEQRAATDQDILNLVNLPLGQARDLADATFGKFANEAMAHRKEIRDQADARSAAIEEAKVNGKTRDQQRREQSERAQKTLMSELTSGFEYHTKALDADPIFKEYFAKRGEEGREPTPEEAQWNSRIEKGMQSTMKDLVQSRLDDPKLTPDDRKQLLKRKSVMIKRAAGWPALRWERDTLKAQVADLQKQLDGYKSSSPLAGGRQRSSTPAKSGGSALDKTMSSLDKLARPGS